MGVVLGIVLPAPNDPAAINRVILAQECTSSGLVSRDQGRPTASKEIQDDAIAGRNILDRVSNHLNGLGGRMNGEFFHAAGLEGVDPTILPDIGAVAPMLAELETVDVRLGAVLEGENQFMTGAIKGAHAAIVFDPHNQVL